MPPRPPAAATPPAIAEPTDVGTPVDQPVPVPTIAPTISRADIITDQPVGGVGTIKPTPARMQNLILGPTPAVVREDGAQLPTPAALDYIAGNVRRPSLASLPPGPDRRKE